MCPPFGGRYRCSGSLPTQRPSGTLHPAFDTEIHMIHVLATITTLPGKRGEVLALFKNNVPAVLAEAGCISYEAVRDVPDFGKIQTPLGPDTFIVTERWESGAALKAHAASAHMAEYGRATAPLLASRVINVLEAV
jgi:quinol monooxygenase YgiN